MKKDEIGNRYGALTVIEEGAGVYEGRRKRPSYICKCDCGNIEEYNIRALRRGNVKYCRTHNKKEDVVGEKVGTFTVVEELESIERQYEYGKVTERRFKVVCDCGGRKRNKLNCI